MWVQLDDSVKLKFFEAPGQLPKPVHACHGVVSPCQSEKRNVDLCGGSNEHRAKPDWRISECLPRVWCCKGTSDDISSALRSLVPLCDSDGRSGMRSDYGIASALNTVQDRRMNDGSRKLLKGDIKLRKRHGMNTMDGDVFWKRVHANEGALKPTVMRTIKVISRVGLRRQNLRPVQAKDVPDYG